MSANKIITVKRQCGYPHLEGFYHATSQKHMRERGRTAFCGSRIMRFGDDYRPSDFLVCPKCSRQAYREAVDNALHEVNAS